MMQPILQKYETCSPRWCSFLVMRGGCRHVTFHVAYCINRWEQRLVWSPRVICRFCHSRYLSSLFLTARMTHSVDISPAPSTENHWFCMHPKTESQWLPELCCYARDNQEAWRRYNTSHLKASARQWGIKSLFPFTVPLQSSRQTLQLLVLIFCSLPIIL